MPKNHKYDLNDRVQITISGETGVITAVCQYISSETKYELLYCEKGTGKATSDWWSECELTPAYPTDNNANLSI